ncbi:DNA-directed RNA polymerase I subunit 2 [Tanacetum coccineum]|uniref:DNA-directed RNA polymerase n=1 Tax=Tanacetum coccineum TaxID=301880 RepID=A0ABQ5J0X7_9ASTR
MDLKVNSPQMSRLKRNYIQNVIERFYTSVFVASVMNQYVQHFSMDTTILGCNDFNPYQNLKAGMTVMAEKLIFLSFLSHFRAVLRGSSLAGLCTTCALWGFVCPVHTPDGAPCGLLNHMTASCLVCRYFRQSASSLPILQLPICNGTWVLKIKESNRQPLAILRPNSSLRAALNLFVQAEFPLLMTMTHWMFTLE